MIGGAGFARARIRANLAPLIALAVVSAIAAALVAGMVAVVRVVETRAAVLAVEAAGDGGDRVVVRYDASAADAPKMPQAVQGALAAIGAPGALSSEVGDGELVLFIDPARFSGDAAIALVAGLPDLSREIDARADADAQVSGGLRTTLLDVRDGLVVRRGPTAVAIGVLALMTAVTVAAVAVEPVRVRAGEHRLLRARGARRRSLVGLTAVETAVFAGMGAVLGAALGQVLVAVVAGIAVDPLVAAVAALATIAVAVVAGCIAAMRGADRSTGRVALTAGVTAAVLAAVVTGVAAWQFLRAGTPMVERGDGSLVLDPLVMLAPALVLAFAGLLAVLLAGPLARGVAALTARGRSVTPVTPLRLASRRPGRHALPTATVAFAIGAVVLAASYVGTLDALGSTPEAVRVGADVRVTSVPEDQPVPPVAELDAVDAVMGVLAADARGSRETVRMLAAESSALPDVMLDPDGAIGLDALAADLAPDIVGIALPGNAVELGIRIRVEDMPPVVLDDELIEVGPPSVYASVWLLDESGRVVVASAESFESVVEDAADGGESLRTEPTYDRTTTVALPDGGPWSIVAVTAVNIQPWNDAPGVRVDVDADGGPVDLMALHPAPGTPGDVTTDGTGLVFTLAHGDGFEFSPTRAVVDSMPTSAPAAITADLAESLAVETGDSVSLRLSSLGLDADLDLVAVIPVLPGTPDGQGVLTDLAALSLSSAQWIAPNELWVATDQPQAVVAEIDALAPATRTMVADPRAAESAAATGVSFLLAAAGAVALAVVVLVLRRTRGRGDARELAMLAVMGLGRAGASRVRVSEDLFAIAMGVAGGATAGTLTAWLVVPPLARAAYVAVPDGLVVELRPDLAVLLIGVGFASIAFCAVAASIRAPRTLAPLVREDE
ncbi:hypothetical protein GCM10022200_08590 [Microbacterium awajiense]|uniref:ABC3 transporter permease protein domain-containing protein n=1 Tax=Microbacterium awajiense TaxID=415214 RepID=A0ABP7AAU6_9MICO